MKLFPVPARVSRSTLEYQSFRLRPSPSPCRSTDLGVPIPGIRPHAPEHWVKMKTAAHVAQVGWVGRAGSVGVCVRHLEKVGPAGRTV